MKTPLIAITLAAACSGNAHAQSVTLYGAVDAGLIKRTGSATAIGKRDANTLGVKGSEELGAGLKALFHLEMRYEPDTGTQESVVRPMFQGQSRVGLAGPFGTLRIGRGVTAYMEAMTAFEPFHGIPSPAGFYTDVAVAGYTTQPLDAGGNSFNRISNAVWYNTPEWGGFQVNVTLASREANNGPAIVGRGTTAIPQYGPGAQASANPYSVSATYKRGPLGAMVGVERNGIESDVWSLAAFYKPVTPLKLMAIYGRQDRAHTMAANAGTRAWVLGANYVVGGGTFLVGYGRKEPDGAVATRQTSIGYEYPLSKRTFLYADASRKRAASAVNHVDLGIRATF
ncbi:porin [Massilia sp. PAMC28688]|uniref:porin n=1 Tax=Massilia sp. PAMC28688 TaxID=2861283 RepID=UPI001C62B210|nr:porin [Massilia sp. PAMC28688]QYF93434.1 porin [Massilia sp. PAMC28688]